ILGCLDRATSGTYRFEGNEVTSLADDALAAMRNRRIGFVFQSFNLLARASALQNVELPMIYAGIARHARLARARALLTIVGLGDRLHHTPVELSGGQQHRVAIARAGLTIIMVTHDEAIARCAGRVLRFKDGAVLRANDDEWASRGALSR